MKAHVWIVECSIGSTDEWFATAVENNEKKAEALAELLRKAIPSAQYRVAKYERVER